MTELGEREGCKVPIMYKFVRQSCVVSIGNVSTPKLSNKSCQVTTLTDTKERSKINVFSENQKHRLEISELVMFIMCTLVSRDFVPLLSVYTTSFVPWKLGYTW